MLHVARSAIMPPATANGYVPGNDIAKVLTDVRQDLQHHFAEEEGGGCLKEAVSRCPDLSDEVRRIEAEHPRLLENVDRLIAQARDSDRSLSERMAVAREFDELCAPLNAHEEAENAMLRKGFGANVNGVADKPHPESKLLYDV